MRKIRLEKLASSKQWELWRRSCDAAKAEIEGLAERGEPLQFKEKLYRRKSIRRLYFFSGLAPFFGKCAYCEAKLELIDGDLDHFRPKAEVCDLAGEPVFIAGSDGETRKHPGYFWLAYDWENLLPCCKTCNQLHKKSRFPVDGLHATKASEIANEKPMLLHPGSTDPADDPENHLDVNPATGIMVPLTARGAATIEVLALNREGLPEQRRTASLAARALLLDVIHGATEARTQLSEIEEGRQPFFMAQKATLQGMARFIARR